MAEVGQGGVSSPKRSISSSAESPAAKLRREAARPTLCLSGGGWKAYTGHSAVLTHLLKNNASVGKLFHEKFDAVTSISGGSWFAYCLLFSAAFNATLEGCAGLDADAAANKWFAESLRKFQQHMEEFEKQAEEKAKETGKGGKGGIFMIPFYLAAHFKDMMEDAVNDAKGKIEDLVEGDLKPMLEYMEATRFSWNNFVTQMLKDIVRADEGMAPWYKQRCAATCADAKPLEWYITVVTVLPTHGDSSRLVRVKDVGMLSYTAQLDPEDESKFKAAHNPPFMPCAYLVKTGGTAAAATGSSKYQFARTQLKSCSVQYSAEGMKESPPLEVNLPNMTVQEICVGSAECEAIDSAIKTPDDIDHGVLNDEILYRISASSAAAGLLSSGAASGIQGLRSALLKLLPERVATEMDVTCYFGPPDELKSFAKEYYAGGEKSQALLESYNKNNPIYPSPQLKLGSDSASTDEQASQLALSGCSTRRVYEWALREGRLDLKGSDLCEKLKPLNVYDGGYADNTSVTRAVAEGKRDIFALGFQSDDYLALFEGNGTKDLSKETTSKLEMTRTFEIFRGTPSDYHALKKMTDPKSGETPKPTYSFAGSSPTEATIFRPSLKLDDDSKLQDLYLLKMTNVLTKENPYFAPEDRSRVPEKVDLTIIVMKPDDSKFRGAGGPVGLGATLSTNIDDYRHYYQTILSALRTLPEGALSI